MLVCLSVSVVLRWFSPCRVMWSRDSCGRNREYFLGRTEYGTAVTRMFNLERINSYPYPYLPCGTVQLCTRTSLPTSRPVSLMFAHIFRFRSNAQHSTCYLLVTSGSSTLCRELNELAPCQCVPGMSFQRNTNQFDHR